MSCAGKGYGRKSQSNDYLYSQFGFNPSIATSTKRCRRFNGFYPSFTPKLFNLSVSTSASGSYSLVYVNGSNFLPFGTTFIKFGNLGYLPTTFYSSFNLSFVVPINALPGNYPVSVVNLYNGNFSPQVNQSYSGTLDFSQPIIYTIT